MFSRKYSVKLWYVIWFYVFILLSLPFSLQAGEIVKTVRFSYNDLSFSKDGGYDVVRLKTTGLLFL
ncbi:MAG: hypothetical protein QMD71_01155 [bacterium]|nr:hypothetical protein [bacterium]